MMFQFPMDREIAMSPWGLQKYLKKGGEKRGEYQTPPPKSDF